MMQGCNGWLELLKAVDTSLTLEAELKNMSLSWLSIVLETLTQGGTKATAGIQYSTIVSLTGINIATFHLGCYTPHSRDFQPRW